MEVQIFGKRDCARCEAARKKVAFFLQKWGLHAQVPVTFVDMDTVEGRAEAAFQDVAKVPTTIALNGGSETGRWAGGVPDSDDLRRALGLIS